MCAALSSLDSFIFFLVRQKQNQSKAAATNTPPMPPTTPPMTGPLELGALPSTAVGADDDV